MKNLYAVYFDSLARNLPIGSEVEIPSSEFELAQEKYETLKSDPRFELTTPIYQSESGRFWYFKIKKI